MSKEEFIWRVFGVCSIRELSAEDNAIEEYFLTVIGLGNRYLNIITLKKILLRNMVLFVLISGLVAIFRQFLQPILLVL